MPSTSLATVTGEREVLKAMRQVGADAADLRAAHVRVADMLTPLAAQRTRRRTGALAASWTPSGTAGVARLRSTLPYAGPMEFGWPARGIPRTLAVFGAALDNMDGIHDIYADELRAAIDRAGLAP